MNIIDTNHYSIHENLSPMAANFFGPNDLCQNIIINVREVTFLSIRIHKYHKAI